MTIPKPSDFRRVFTSTAIVVLEVLVSIGVIGFFAIELYKAVSPVPAIAASPAAIERVEQKIDRLEGKVDDVNTRLSRLEGVLTGATKP